jgi:hypothetical protein
MVNQANGRTVQAADRRRNQKATANPEPAAGGKLTAAAKISRENFKNFPAAGFARKTGNCNQQKE